METEFQIQDTFEMLRPGMTRFERVADVQMAIDKMIAVEGNRERGGRTRREREGGWAGEKRAPECSNWFDDEMTRYLMWRGDVQRVDAERGREREGVRSRGRLRRGKTQTGNTVKFSNAFTLDVPFRHPSPL
jgi:hypothetical protein